LNVSVQATGICFSGMYASLAGYANIIGTEILVVTINGLAAADALPAEIMFGAKVAIITGRITERQMGTPFSHRTGILCAGVAIITGNRLPFTDTVRTGVPVCAGIEIITGHDMQRLMGTPCFPVTSIHGALIPVIAINRFADASSA
jgi:hypothetical protein